MALVLASLQVVCIVDGSIWRIVRRNTKGSNDAVLSLNGIFIVGVRKSGITVIAGDRLGDTCARRVSGRSCGFVCAIKLI